MIVYFDESYDNEHDYLLYGALFVPASSTLHQRVAQVREETGYQREIKYNRCKNNTTLMVYEKIVNAFVDDEAYFRCVVVDQHRFDYSRFGRPDEPNALLRARAYKKFAEMLLHPNVSQVENAVFIADAMTRCHGDDFLEKMRERFNPPGGKRTFRHLAEVSSRLEQYQCLQVCDLLLGCVKNNLKPARKPAKNEIRDHLCKRLGVPNFLFTAWKNVPLAEAKDPSVKFNVWHWSARRKLR